MKKKEKRKREKQKKEEREENWKKKFNLSIIRLTVKNSVVFISTINMRIIN